MRKNFFLAFVMTFGVLALGPRLYAQTPINNRLHSTFAKAKAKNLASGMTASQVEDILGKPDNMDWVQGYRIGDSVIRVWLCVAKRLGELKTWRNYVADHRKYGLGFFFIVADDHLTSPVPALTSKDFDVLYNLDKGRN